MEVKALSAKDFANTLFAAIESNSEPDIIHINNYGLIEGITTDLGSFIGIASRKKVRDSLIAVQDALKSLGRGWQFLVSTSRNYRKARALVMDVVTCSPIFSQDINELQNSELESIRSVAVSSAFAYLTCDTETMNRVSDESRLAPDA